MAYIAKPSTDVENLERQYKVMAASLPNQNTEHERTIITTGLTGIARRAELRLKTDMDIISGYFDQHSQKVDRWLAEAQQAHKDAKSAAAGYKKSPGKPELAAAVRNNIERIQRTQTAFDTDAFEFGQAWIGYRELEPANIPAEHFVAFKAARSTLMNAQKATSIKYNKISAALREAQALLDITAKAERKATNAGRSLEDAITAARQVASDLELQLTNLKDPDNTKPANVTSGSRALVLMSTDRNLTTKQNLLTARGVWKNAQAAYKAMTTKAASMEKVLAAKTKGFHKAELLDFTIKAELRKAAKTVSDAKAEVKKYDRAYADAKKAIDKVEANLKRLGVQ